jgi:dihydrofolate reductase
MKKTLVVVVVALFAIVNMSFAQEPAVVTSSKTGWHKIGETKADFKTESEGILVMGEDTFKSIKLKVTDAPVNISKVIIYYENKQTQEVPIDGVIQAGMESKMIELEYPTVEIQKVVFTYKSEPSYKGDKAHVELHGLK